MTIERQLENWVRILPAGTEITVPNAQDIVTPTFPLRVIRRNLNRLRRRGDLATGRRGRYLIPYAKARTAEIPLADHPPPDNPYPCHAPLGLVKSTPDR